MNFLAASLLIFLSLGVLGAYASSPLRESCSCAADDRSCEVSGSCPGGCMAFCPSRECRFTCVSEDEGQLNRFDPGQPISLRLDGGNSRQLAAQLARLIKREVVVTPRQPDDTFHLDVKDMPLWEVLNIISAQGRIRIGMEDFGHLRALRGALVSGEPMAFCFSNVTARRLAEELSFLTGTEIQVTGGSLKTVVTYSGNSVTYEQMLEQVSLSSGVQFAAKR